MATHWLNTENKLYLTEVKSYTRDGWTSMENLESKEEFDFSFCRICLQIWVNYNKEDVWGIIFFSRSYL